MPGKRESGKKADAAQQKQKKAQPAPGTGMGSKKGEQSSGNRRKYGAVAFITVIILVLAGGLVYGLNQSQPTSFRTFQDNFNSAKNVSILVRADNGTALASTIGCATNLIYALVTAGGAQHRSSSSIGFYVLNATSCVYSSQPLGTFTKNYSYSTPSKCLNMTAATPRIFINYSSTNSTALITPTALYVFGNAKFLSQCGISSEITSR